MTDVMEQVFNVAYWIGMGTASAAIVVYAGVHFAIPPVAIGQELGSEFAEKGRPRWLGWVIGGLIGLAISLSISCVILAIVVSIGRTFGAV